MGGLIGAIGGFRTHHTMEFRDDFYDMQLFRDNVLVPPIERYREPAGIFYEDLNVEMKDKASGSAYFYDPATFEPGSTLTLKVRRESNLTRGDEVRIDRNSQIQIWKEFEGYRSMDEPNTR